jgi:kynurenine 3-monooxygenase
MVFLQLFLLSLDIRTAKLVIGRSINLALSERGRKALAEVGLEQKMLEHGIPMYGRMLHDLNGKRTIVPYDARTHKVLRINYVFEIM